MHARRLHRQPGPHVHRAEVAAVHERETRAQRWIEASIRVWEEEERVTPVEAATLREKLGEPTVLAVLPHFGVHLAIGAVLRFPFGSITRAGYTLFQFLLATLHLFMRRIDRTVWRQATSIHSPLVILGACLPGFGTFAYLAAKPVRRNHLLLRVGLDAVLLKLPFHVYERTGFRWSIAQPRATVVEASHRRPQLNVTAWAPNIVLVLGCIVVALAAADFIVQTLIALGLVDAEKLGWNQISRMVDLDAEASFGTWYSAMSLVLLSALLAGIAYVRRVEGDQFARHWLVLALLPLGFSLDEIVHIHDPGGNGFIEIRDRLGLSGPLLYSWVIFGALSVLVVALMYRDFIAHLPRGTQQLYVFAAGLFVTGEVVMEMFSGWRVDISGEKDYIYQVITTFEESFSMAGIFIAVAATLHYIQTSFSSIQINLLTSDPEPVPARTVTDAVPDTVPAEEQDALTNGYPAPLPQPAVVLVDTSAGTSTTSTSRT